MTACCERCGTSPDKYDEDSQAAIRLLEIQTSFTFNAVLCLQCRRDWYKFVNASTNMRVYTENGFRLEHWRIAHRKSGKEDVDVGLGFVRKLNDLDEVLNNEAQAWLEAGRKGKRRDEEDDDQDRRLRVHDDDFNND
jgi:hypothetical protein